MMGNSAGPAIWVSLMNKLQGKKWRKNLWSKRNLKDLSANHNTWT